MTESELGNAKLLAEVLRLQRWAGGDSVSAAKIWGMMHGIESVIREESGTRMIDRETQDKIEYMLEDIEAGKQSADDMGIKERLRKDKINESDARTVMELCRLQSRLPDAIQKIVNSPHPFSWSVGRQRLPEQDWFGLLLYMELCDGTEDAHTKLHSVFSPVVPRVGEIVTPEGGSKMQVIAVEHVMAKQGEDEGVPHRILIPYVYLVPVDEPS